MTKLERILILEAALCVCEGIIPRSETHKFVDKEIGAAFPELSSEFGDFWPLRRRLLRSLPSRRKFSAELARQFKAI